MIGMMIFPSSVARPRVTGLESNRRFWHRCRCRRSPQFPWRRWRRPNCLTWCCSKNESYPRTTRNTLTSWPPSICSEILWSLKDLRVNATLTDYPLFDFDTGEVNIATYGVPSDRVHLLGGQCGSRSESGRDLDIYFDGSGSAIESACAGVDVTGRGKLKGGVEVFGFDLISASAGIDLTLSPELCYVAGDWDFGLDGSAVESPGRPAFSGGIGRDTSPTRAAGRSRWWN